MFDGRFDDRGRFVPGRRRRLRRRICGGNELLPVYQSGQRQRDRQRPGLPAGGWTATTDGAIWISTGGATPVLNTQDLNFQLDYRSTPTSPWVTLTGAYLLSNGVADGDVVPGGNPADTIRVIGRATTARRRSGRNTTPDSTSPYRIVAKGPGIYYLPGTQPTGSPPVGKATQPGMQFDLYAWTGDYNSFAAAAGAAKKLPSAAHFK